jgi:hypothetical protein
VLVVRALIASLRGESDDLVVQAEACQSLGAASRAAQLRCLAADQFVNAGRFEEAIEQADQASRAAERMGLTHAVLRASATRAWAEALKRAEEADEVLESDADETIDALVPMVLAIGALRSRVRTVQARTYLGWLFDTNLERAAQAALRGSNPQVLIEILETGRLFALLERGPQARTSGRVSTSALNGATPQDAIDVTDATCAIATRLEGEGTYLSAESHELPLASPPRLIMPWGGIALAHFHDLAEERYGLRMVADTSVALGDSI